MVFHAFKGDEEIDSILKPIPHNQKSKFIKEALKHYVAPEAIEEKKVEEKPIPKLRGIKIV